MAAIREEVEVGAFEEDDFSHFLPGFELQKEAGGHVGGPRSGLCVLRHVLPHVTMVVRTLPVT